ncbi:MULTISPECIES: glycosyltransferase family 2 protein [Olivibacter]|jgi:glycosyltransferase involved in cell wall biosynthesis|uniref:Glycosyltransferase family 2 protein n=1 Tax=Olivibacter oleidegradans TaxID=760123 RepID=A0ABV6HGK9_9SPHI|nr:MULTISPECIES: glycosyltransferase family 2 protein [Olivibacter]QEL00495.1 glycosyltransferase [Olivibacter sp. LS-1]
MEIAVIIPVYNAEAYVADAVQSALQFEEVKEVILIEDCSPDNALAVCKELERQHERVKLYQHENGINKGAGASRNLGIQKATCPYIAFLDADDLFLTNRFDAEREYWREGKDFDAMYGALGIHFYSQEAQEKYASHFSSKFTVVRNFKAGESMFEELLGINEKRRGHIHLDTLTVRKVVLARMPMHFQENLRLHQDYEFTIRLGYYAQVVPGILAQAIATRGVHLENRYTKVGFKEKKYYRNQLLVWEALDRWAQEEGLAARYKQFIARKIYAYKIAGSYFFSAWSLFLKYLLKERQVLKEYRIYYRTMLNR